MSGADEPVEIAWDAARATNHANWEERVPLHLDAYDIASLRDDPARLSGVVETDMETMRAHLGPDGLTGLDVCHLQCHIGTDTVSLARAGAARVVGVDFSASALEAAAALARELGVDARWVETDVLAARAAVDRELGPETVFDVVYTSIGAISWLNDLDTWAAQVAALLTPGGLFYIRDGHPVLYALDEDAATLELRYRYFGDGRALAWDEDTTYVGDGRITHTRTYEWPHPLSEVVMALLGAGLVIERLDEGRTLPWRFSDRMIELPDGNFVWPDEDAWRVPCTFTVVARRPA